MARMEPTLIISRRVLVELNASLTGFTLVSFLERSKASIAASSEERAPPRQCGWRELLASIETRDSDEGVYGESAGQDEPV